jgi:hypothetical protein
MTHDVFISYSSKDKDIADLICEAMERAGLLCWIAPRNVTPGSKYAREIIAAIEACQVMFLIFSESANKSEHIENEIDTAFNKGKIIVPFKITDTEMSEELQYYLRKKHWIDGTPEPHKCIDELVSRVVAIVPRLSKTVRKEETFSRLDQILAEYREIEYNDIVERKKLEALRDRINDALSEGICSMVYDDFNSTSGDNSEGDGNSGKYNIFQNGAGEILIIISVKPGAPVEPRLIYDGGDFALLYRSRECSLRFSEINVDARSALMAVDKVLVVEVENNDVSREYDVPIRHVKSLDTLLKMARKEVDADRQK